MRDYELVNLDGKLALYSMTLRDRERPVIVAHYYTSNIPVDRCEHILGKVPWWPSGSPFQGLGKVRNEWGGEVTIDCHDWQLVTVETPVQRPRNGQLYGWEFLSGRWTKRYFDRCPDCGKYHDPEFTLCDNCGKCHRPGAKCKPVECAGCGTTFAADGSQSAWCTKCR